MEQQCRVCRCSESHACFGGCLWDLDDPTICSTCALAAERLLEWMGISNVEPDFFWDALHELVNATNELAVRDQRTAEAIAAIGNAYPARVS
jgi:hypothetical protein